MERRFPRQDRLKSAESIQNQIAKNVVIAPLEREIKTVAGVDAAFKDEMTVAAVCVYDFETLECLQERHHVLETSFPYIPGYLTFREGPAMIEAIGKAGVMPDLLIFDGQGTAHPRRCGIASHIGVLMGRPAVGCAKSRLVGEHEKPGSERGSFAPLYYKGEIVGAALTTRSGCKPVYVSPGHLITLEESIEIILRLSSRFRIPEPIRCADRLAGELKRKLCFEKKLP